MAPSGMRGAWWWIDRWRKSTAYTDMTLAEQGAYRNLLDELWLRGGVLPDDERILAKIGGDAVAWPTVREAVLKRFTVTPEGLRHPTHDEVRLGLGKFKEAQAEKGKARAEKASRGPAGRFQPSQPESKPALQPPDQPPYTVHRTTVQPDPSPVERTAAAATARANPLVGDRLKLETECLRLVREVAAMTGDDPTEVIRAAADFKGAVTAKVNPASMSDDRLMLTVSDLRKRLASEKAKRNGAGDALEREHEEAYVINWLMDKRAKEANGFGQVRLDASAAALLDRVVAQKQGEVS